MEKNKFLLVSVKSKKSPAQSQGQVYVVSKEDISSFVKKVLDDDSVLLIDSVETFVSDSLSTDEPLSTDNIL
jgi:hypothetical protein